MVSPVSVRTGLLVPGCCGDQQPEWVCTLGWCPPGQQGNWETEKMLQVQNWDQNADRKARASPSGPVGGLNHLNKGCIVSGLQESDASVRRPAGRRRPQLGDPGTGGPRGVAGGA
ncbi:uncharacterized protein LOC143667178 isoform X2 [Tamandua tetradactyla]|uniref:uncharacterized protein LOC143667178 isoform X2 n=1 Tax=Tamandua tetradactyla TaxID=48850 RepID=UPI004054851B